MSLEGSKDISYFERRGSSVRMHTDFISLEEVKTEGSIEINFERFLGI